jgi:uncharacterized protein (DUF1800 family)
MRSYAQSFAHASAALALVGAFAAADAATPQPTGASPDTLFASGFEPQFAFPTNDAEAARFLAQATFGATTAEIARVRSIGYSAWIDAQFQAPASTQVPYLDWVENLPSVPEGNNHVTDATRVEIWTINAVGTPDPSRGNAVPTDQLRQRVAFALSQIFVVSSQNGTLTYQPWALASWYDMLVANSFGNFRTLIEGVSLHPAMGIYLSHIQNQKADPARNIRPDENYAREVMQLFSIGLVMLQSDGTVRDGNPSLAGVQPIPTYDQATVRGFAQVFTGWNWNNTSCGPTTYTCCTEDSYLNCGPYGYNLDAWKLPMQPINAFHDILNSKQLLDYPGAVPTNGLLPAGGSAQADLAAALDNLARHPNVGPFISYRLIQRLVTSNPSPAYVQRVAAAWTNNGAGVRGDLKAVVRAILLDPEARLGHQQQPTTFGKLREPLIKTTHLWRAMAARSTAGRVADLNPYPQIEAWYGQGPLRSPSVFNFYRPDYRQPGEVNNLGLASPEFQILSDTMAVSTPNRLFSLSFCFYTNGSGQPDERCWTDGRGATMYLDTQRDAPLAASNPAALIDRYDLLFLSGQMSSYMRGILLARLQAIDDSNATTRGRLRVQHALYLILNSPEYSIQK